MCMFVEIREGIKAPHYRCRKTRPQETGDAPTTEDGRCKDIKLGPWGFWIDSHSAHLVYRGKSKISIQTRKTAKAVDRAQFRDWTATSIETLRRAEEIEPYDPEKEKNIREWLKRVLPEGDPTAELPTRKFTPWERDEITKNACDYINWKAGGYINPGGHPDFDIWKGISPYAIKRSSPGEKPKSEAIVSCKRCNVTAKWNETFQTYQCPQCGDIDAKLFEWKYPEPEVKA